jgi:hypothetical protein
MLRALIAVLASALALGQGVAFAEPVQDEDGHYYEYVNGQLTWSSAETSAEGSWAHLVTIQDAGENAFVQSLIEAGPAWIGATDTDTEGLFLWVTGEPFAYSNWAPGEPDDDFLTGGAGDWLAMMDDGTWIDTNGNFVGFVQGFVEEWTDIAITNRAVTEGDSGTVNVRLRVDLSGPSPQTVTVDYTTGDGTAKQPGDYTQTSGTLTFAPGQTSKQINVPVQGDLLDEKDEKFNVQLSNQTNALIADGVGLATIRDDDPTPSVSIADAPIRNEGNRHRFPVTLSAPSGQRVVVDYTTQDGTAVAGDDYTPKSGTLAFPPGQVVRNVDVFTVEDAVIEPNETFTVELSNPLHGTIADGSGGTTIKNDDT